MKQTILILTFAVFTARAGSQALTPQVVASTGAFTVFDGGSFSYTVGEMSMVETFISSDESVVLTQGFQQPDLFSSTAALSEPAGSNKSFFTLYPNPAVDNIWYNFQFAGRGEVNVSVYNAIGQNIANVYDGDYTSGTVSQTIHVADFAAGIYFLNVAFTSATDGNSSMVSKKFIVLN